MSRFDCTASVNTQSLTQFAETMRLRLGCPKNFSSPDENTILFLRSGSRDFTHDLYKLDLTSNQESILYTSDEVLNGSIEHLSPEEKARRERLRLVSKGFSAFKVLPNNKQLLIPLSGKVHIVPTDKSSDLKPFDISSASGGHDVTVSPDGKKISFTRGGTLYVTDIHEVAPATCIVPWGNESSNQHITYGTAEFCAQEEMSRFSGHWWSPCSKYIVFQETDETLVDSIYISDPSKPTKMPTAMKYPRTGTNNPRVRLFVTAVENPDVYAELDMTCFNEEDGFIYEYLNTVTWLSSTNVAIVIQNREQTESKIIRFDVSSLETSPIQPQLLVEYNDSAWINIDQTVPLPVKDGNYFIHSTDQSGVPVLELRDSLTGEKVAQITDNSLYYRQILGFDASTSTLYIYAGPNPTNQLVFAIPLASVLNSVTDSSMGDKLQNIPVPLLVTPGRGVHVATFLPSTKPSVPSRIIDAYENIDGTYPIQILTLPQSIATATTHSNLTILPDPFVQDSIPSDNTLAVQLEPYTIKNNAEMPTNPIRFGSIQVNLKSSSLHGVLVYPTNFDKNAGKKLPLVVYVYGGPGFRVVSSSPRPLAFHQMLADHGFAVLSVDGRGTPLRGRDWERAIKDDFITVPMNDQAEAVLSMSRGEFFTNFVANHDDKDLYTSQSIIDTIDFDQVGVYGWSFGGYFSAMASMLRPDVYKACVSGAPVSDWTLYDTHYTERYISFPYISGKSSLLDGTFDPTKQTDAFIKSRVMTYTKQMDSNLLIIHGTADDNVVFGHATAMSDALFRAGKVHEFLPLTDFTHMVADPSVTIALYSRIIDFFRRNLRKI